MSSRDPGGRSSNALSFGDVLAPFLDQAFLRHSQEGDPPLCHHGDEGGDHRRLPFRMWWILLEMYPVQQAVRKEML